MHILTMPFLLMSIRKGNIRKWQGCEARSARPTKRYTVKAQKEGGWALTGNLRGEQVAALEGVDHAERLERALVVPDQRVHAQQAHQAEVAHHAQHVGALVVALCCVKVLLPRCKPEEPQQKGLSRCGQALVLPCGGPSQNAEALSSQDFQDESQIFWRCLPINPHPPLYAWAPVDQVWDACSLTSSGQLFGDARLVSERLQVVEDAEDGPDLVAAAQRLQLLCPLRAQLPAVLLPALELVHKLIHHVP